MGFVNENMYIMLIVLTGHHGEFLSILFEILGQNSIFDRDRLFCVKDDLLL